MNYYPDELGTFSPTSLDWAISWFRVFSNDKPVNGVYPSFALSDLEIEGFLTLTAIVEAGVTYYRPHEAVAVRILSNPAYATSVNEEGYSATYRTANELANAIRSSGEAIFAYDTTTSTSTYPKLLALGL